MVRELVHLPPQQSLPGPTRSQLATVATRTSILHPCHRRSVSRLSGAALGHWRRRNSALRFSPANPRLDDIGLCERAVPGYIRGHRPVPVHYCRHDHQSRWGVPDHLHRWDARLPRLYIRVRTRNPHPVTGYDDAFVEISDSDSLLRVRRHSYRFRHVSRRQRQLLVHSVRPDDRFRFLRRKHRPEHFPGHLFRERHVFGRCQFHGLVIDARIDSTGHFALPTGGAGNGTGNTSAPGGAIGPSLTGSSAVALASAQSSAQTYEDDASVSLQTQEGLENQAHIDSLLSGALRRQAEANANHTGSTQGSGTVAPPERAGRRRQRAEMGSTPQLPVVQRRLLPGTASTRVWSSARAGRSVPS